MIVHSYYYGPVGNKGLDLQTTRNLTSIVNEDVIRKLYTMDSNPKKRIEFSNLYQTLKGPVLGVTRIDPATSHDHRQTLVNKTLFVRLEEVVRDLIPLLDDVAPPLKLLNVTLSRVEG